MIAATGKSEVTDGGAVCFLFTDFANLADLLQALGDQKARKLWNSHLSILRRTAKEMGGAEMQSPDDGLVFVFESVKDALRSAVSMQKAISRSNATNDHCDGLQLRIGLHLGEPTSEGNDKSDRSVLLAGRLCNVAEGGRILASEAVHDAVASFDFFDFSDRGSQELKGFKGQWRVYEVQWKKDETPADFASATAARETPFVGRDKELKQLRQLLWQSKSGKGSLVLIRGEPGVGKTRITRELAKEARELGFFCFTGHCQEMGSNIPYAPFIEILQSAFRIIKLDVMAQVIGDSTPEIDMLMPEIRRKLPESYHPTELPPDQRRRQLFDYAREIVIRASNAQPQFLILDDLHWADETTVLLLDHIVGSLEGVSVMIVGTYRDTDLNFRHPLRTAIERFLHVKTVSQFTLKCFSKDEVGAMLRARTGEKPPNKIVERIYDRTAGNPLFVEEIFKQSLASKDFFDHRGNWRKDILIEQLRVPENIRLLIERRIDSLGEACRRVLAAAALIGRDFTIELVKKVVALDENWLVEIFDKAEKAQLVSSIQKGERVGLVFSHDLVRQTLLHDLSLPRRQRLHAQIAAGIEELNAHSTEDCSTELAHHLYQAGAFVDFSKTSDYLVRAGDRAYESAAFEQALRQYNRALSLQVQDERGRAELYLKRGLAMRGLKRLDEALASWRESLRINCEELGEREKAGHICAMVSSELLGAQRWMEAQDIVQEGLKILGDSVSDARCLLLAASGFIASYVPGVGFDYANGLFDQALKIVDELGKEELLGAVLGRKSGLHHVYWQGKEEADAGAKAAESMRKKGDLYGAALGLAYAQCGYLRIGRFDKAAEFGAESKVLAERTGSRYVTWFTETLEMKMQVMATGDLSRFEAQNSSLIKSRDEKDQSWVEYDYTALGLAHFWLGRWNEARKDFETGMQHEVPGMTFGHCLAAFLIFLAYQNERDYVLSVLDKNREVLPRHGQPNPLDSWALLDASVEGLAVLGEWERVGQLYPLARDAVATGNILRPQNAGSVLCIAGMAATGAGQWEDAEEYFQKTLRIAHTTPLRIEQPEARRWYAQMLIRRNSPGDDQKARDLLEEAAELYRVIGMPRHVGMTEKLVASLPRNSSL